jgi:hypothetical protein
MFELSCLGNEETELLLKHLDEIFRFVKKMTMLLYEMPLVLEFLALGEATHVTSDSVIESSNSRV